MATYTGGLKINNKAIAKYTENVTAQTVRKAKEIGELVNKEIRERTVIDWFNENGFRRNESWYTMLNSLDYMETTIHAHKGGVTLDFVSFINPEKYRIEHTSLYKQRDKYLEIKDPFKYIVGDLQWGEGIIGLPEKSRTGSWINQYFYQADVNLRDFTTKTYKNNWRKKLNKYWTKIDGRLIDRL